MTIFTEEQEELRSSARRFLEDKSSSAAVRELMETEAGYDEGTWKQMADLGWMGIAIPEAYGGSGYTFVELGILLEEMGRRLGGGVFLSSAVLGATAILETGTEEQKKKLLPGIADGSTRAAFAFTEENGLWTSDGIAAKASKKGSEYLIEGTKMYVIDGHTANLLVVAARSDDGIGFFTVDPEQDEIVRTPLATLDVTRKQARIEFFAARASRLGETADSAAALSRILDRAVVALSSEMIGGAQWCLDTAVDYAKTRVQFGRPIGSFQAIKHKCASMLMELEMAKSAAYYAAWSASEAEEDLPVVASMAKSYCSDAFFSITADTIQVLGGIGFTWEHDAHLYFKRAKSSEILLGDGAYHRELLAQRLGV